MISALLAGLSTSAVAITSWLVLGPTHPITAWTGHFAFTARATVIVDAWFPRPGGRWLRVRPWEAILHRVLGVRFFGWVLERVGWNAGVRRLRQFDPTTSGLQGLAAQTRTSEAGHLLCAVFTAIVCLCLAASGWWPGVGWWVGLAVPLHGYPILLQRTTRLRIQSVAARRARTSTV